MSPPVIAAFIMAGGGLLAGLAAMIGLIQKTRADRRRAEDSVDTRRWEQLQSLLDDYRKERDRDRERLDDLEKERDECRRELRLTRFELQKTKAELAELVNGLREAQARIAELGG